MSRYVCIGCGYEGDEKTIVECVCPYCGEDLEEKKEEGDTGFIDDQAEK